MAAKRMPPAARRLPLRLPPGSGRQPPGRSAAAAAAAGQHPLDRTTPKQNLKTPAYAAILIFCDDLYSPEKRLTVLIRTCRGRAPETSPYHRTRQIAPLLCGRFLVLSDKPLQRFHQHHRLGAGYIQQALYHLGWLQRAAVKPLFIRVFVRVYVLP